MTMELTADTKRLTRAKDERWLGGVCIGLGRYFDLNPGIYRIAFVALAFAGGTGILLYAAAWLVIPEEGAADSIAAAELRKQRDHPKRLLGLAVLAAIGLAVLSSIHLWPSPGNLWVLAALVIAGLAWWRGRIVIGIVLAVVVVLVAGLLLAVRVPVFSGIGSRDYDTVHSKYTLGIGHLQLNLADAKLPKGQTFVKADLGIGDLHVIVPANASVDAEGRVQAGDVVVLGRKDSGTHVHSHVIDRTGSGRVLVLDLRTGLGKIVVERG
jgi:phage shock protein PspC (stress-responsive transcriptional regulator)